jgi:hypothetical protein
MSNTGKTRCIRKSGENRTRKDSASVVSIDRMANSLAIERGKNAITIRRSAPPAKPAAEESGFFCMTVQQARYAHEVYRDKCHQIPKSA